jgi:hypothetical protein
MPDVRGPDDALGVGVKKARTIAHLSACGNGQRALSPFLYVATMMMVMMLCSSCIFIIKYRERDI